MSETIVVVGGGIAGVSCIESLIQGFEQDFPRVILISETRLIKRVTNYRVSGRNLEEFDVIEDDVSTLIDHRVPDGFQLEHITGVVRCANYSDRTLTIDCKSSRTPSTKVISFDRLCLCLGSRPKELEIKHDFPELMKRIIVIRDTSTVEDFTAKLATCHRIAILGNGGISLELISKISNCEKYWIIRDSSIGLTFFDSGAGKFLLDAFNSRNQSSGTSGDTAPEKASSETHSVMGLKTSEKFGPALGPDWLQDLKMKGKQELTNKLNIFYNDEVTDVDISKDGSYPLTVLTKSGKRIECDLVATAIGVHPNLLEFIGDSPEIDEQDGGILIDEQMQTSLPKVYAAGDVVSCKRWPSSELWLRMRLWTQARQMGFYAGRCIAAHILGQDPSIYFNFDCFTHCTSFFGYKLVLLGQFNGQLLGGSESDKCEVIARVKPTKDYVKILIKGGRIIGSVLVGDSGLEETIENLIHDEIDISEFKNQLLDGSVDIEDYFD